jgi:hypothetical protein
MSRPVPCARPYSRQPQHPLMLRQGMETDVFESGNRTELPLAPSAGVCGCCVRSCLVVHGQADAAAVREAVVSAGYTFSGN